MQNENFNKCSVSLILLFNTPYLCDGNVITQISFKSKCQSYPSGLITNYYGNIFNGDHSKHIKDIEGICLLI